MKLRLLLVRWMKTDLMLRTVKSISVLKRDTMKRIKNQQEYNLINALPHYLKSIIYNAKNISCLI